MNTKIFYAVIAGLLCTLHYTCYSQSISETNDKFIIVLDVQQFFTTKMLSESETKEPIQNINALIERTNPEKVIYFKSLMPKILTVSLKGIKVFTATGIEFDKRLNIVNSNIIQQDNENALTNDEIVQLLAKDNTKEIIVVGLLAEECVSRTALGCIEKGYKTYIVPETIMGRTAKSKEKAINKLTRKGVKLISLSEIINTKL